MTQDKNFFEKYGLELTEAPMAIGQTYPIYGMITNVLGESEDMLDVELNFSVRANLMVDCPEKRSLIVERTFEPGIFVSTVTDIQENNRVLVDCRTVVFGKKHDLAAA